MSRTTLFALFVILGGLMALQWHEDQTELRIAQIDADARAALLASIYECPPAAPAHVRGY